MSTPDPWYARGAWGDVAPMQSGIARHTRGLIVAAEASVAAIVGGVVIGGALGWTVVALGVVLVPAVVLLRARWLQGAGDPVTDTGELVAKLRVVGVDSRSSGEIGVLGDGQGFAAGFEVDVTKGAVLDVATLCGVVAGDPSRPSSVQMRLTVYGPPMPSSGVFRRQRGASVATHVRLHVLLRLEPTWAGDVVERHGGGAQGSRAALVAAVDRLSARLRRAGLTNRVLDSAALNALLAEDISTDLRTRLLVADPGSQEDVERLMGLVQTAGPERGVLSFCVDLASSDQWQSYAIVQVGARDVEQRDAVATALLQDRAVLGSAPPSSVTVALPLGGGPGDLTSVLTLARQ